MTATRTAAVAAAALRARAIVGRLVVGSWQVDRLCTVRSGAGQQE
jgi:hypothetical protein